MATADFLLDSFNISGTDFNEFKEADRKFADATHCKEVSVLELPYFAHYAQEYDNKEDKAPFFVLSKEALETVNKGGRIQSGYVNRAKLPSKILMNESGSGNRLFVKFDNQFVTFSDLTFGAFMQKAALDGAGLYVDDLLRNELIVNRLYRRGGKVKFVYREATDPETGKKDVKIFGVMSSRYIYVPQTMIIDVYERIATGRDFNNPVSKGWSIDHGITRIYAEYPDEAKGGLIPGVEIKTSDNGMSSFIVNACERRERSNRYVIINTVSRVHRGDSSDLDEILKEVDEEIFPELRVYPAIFEELDKPIMPPLLTSADKDRQVEMLKDIYKKVFKSMKAGISGKRKKELEKALVDEINPDHEYTWKEIAEQLISVPDRVIGLDETSTVFSAFRKDMGRAPFLLKDIKDKVVPFKTKEDEPELVLA